jgi:hypothetical protein
MINFICLFIKIILNIFKTKRVLIYEIALLKKEPSATIIITQGIEQQLPNKYKSQKSGKILKMPILSGLHHHYYRKAA